MPQIRRQAERIHAVIHQLEATGVAQEMRVDVIDPGRRRSLGEPLKRQSSAQRRCGPGGR